MSAAVLHTDTGMRPRVMAALSYLGILCFVPLIMNRDDEFVYFHSKQGLIIWMWGVLAIFALHVPGIGKWLFSFSAMVVVALSAIGLVSVLLNKAWKLPLIYSLASKF